MINKEKGIHNTFCLSVLSCQRHMPNRVKYIDKQETSLYVHLDLCLLRSKEKH